MNLRQSLCLLTLISFVLSQQAFLFSSSVGFYNYRQNTNLITVYNILKQYNYLDHQITLAFPENVGCCEKNPLQGSLSFLDNDYTNINKQLQVDMKYYDINAQSIAQRMRMRYPSCLPNRLRLQTKAEPYFVYVTGHGGDYYFKIRDKWALVTQNFQHIFRDYLHRTTGEVLVMSDSCSAITPFQGVDHSRFMAIASSSLDEKSQSHGHDVALNSAKSDDFTYYLHELAKERDISQGYTLHQLLKYMDFAKLKVHAKLITHRNSQRRKQLGDFMARRSKIEHVKQMVELPEDLLDVSL